MEGLQSKLRDYNAQADKVLSKYPQVKKLEDTTGVPKTYMAASVVGIVAILIFFNVGGQLISNIIGWVYPAYASFKAIESAQTNDDIQWLTYWTVFGFANVIEFFSDLILYWMPFYYTLKTVFFLWLFLPAFKGAQVVYTKFLRPALKAYQGEIDDRLKNLKDKLGNAIAHEAVASQINSTSDDN